MSANVVGIRGPAPPIAREPNAALVEMLEHYLEMARAGRISTGAVAFSGITGSDWADTVIETGDAHYVIAALECVKLEVTRKLVGSAVSHLDPEDAA